MDIACKLCGRNLHSPIVGVSNANFSSRIKEFEIYQCQHCGLSSMHPFPSSEDMQELYVRENTFSRAYVNPYRSKRSFKFLEPFYQKYGVDDLFIVKECLRRVNKAQKRILDIGCSIGGLLQAFSRYPQIELCGIDIDPRSKDNASPLIRDKIIIGEFLSCGFEEKFDIITMRFVIEHLPDFKAYIRKALSLLSDSGILFISTPDIGSPKARLLKGQWKLINDPSQKIGHLFWFNKKTIGVLASLFHLRIEKCINRGELIYHFPLKIQSVLKRIFGVDPVSGRFIRHYPPRIIYTTIFDSLISQAVGYGEHIYVFMRKI